MEDDTLHVGEKVAASECEGRERRGRALGPGKQPPCDCLSDCLRVNRRILCSLVTALG